MIPSWFSTSDDLSLWAQSAVAVVFLITAVLLALETRRRGLGGILLFVTGVLGAGLLCLAVLRPTKVQVTGQEAKARVVVLTDGSHRLTLPSDERGKTRRQIADLAIDRLKEHWPQARIEALIFGQDDPALAGEQRGAIVHSDLTRALSHVAKEGGERPRAVVVMSDGRLTEPGPAVGEDWALGVTKSGASMPIHTVRLSESFPEDRSIRDIGMTGTAIAHQPFRLHIVIGCQPACDEAPRVRVRELLEGGEPLQLAQGTARGGNDRYELDLEVTLDRAGSRVIEVELEGQGEADEVPENDRRLLPVEVRRDRIRMLHVAGRPTYDVRALRMFLKADESIDLISFFILRTPEDNVSASETELSLIPFPVNELFTEHLPSFDAIILQDIDARTYKLDRHFESIRNYVQKGGGLIMVGGPGAFSAGGYANSPIEEVLPVELPSEGEAVSLQPLVPRYTKAGRAAPMLGGLRQLLGDQLPEMVGTNILGQPRPGAMVLWHHPRLTMPDAQRSLPMPLLALAEVGDGRSIALSVDATHLLRFGRLGAEASGEAHSALWEGLLGWLMRDPRYEAAQVELDGPCLVGHPVTLRVTPLPGTGDEVRLSLTPLSKSEQSSQKEEGFELPLDRREGSSLLFTAEDLPVGGYAARVRVGEAPPTRRVFACEEGGEAYSDSRPDPQRLQRISQVTGGQSVPYDEIESLPPPESTYIAAQRKATPFLPAWAWSLSAALMLCIHWVLRRLTGFS